MHFEDCNDPTYFFSGDGGMISINAGEPRVVGVHGGVPPYTWYITGKIGKEPFKLSYSLTYGGKPNNVIKTTSYVVVGESVEEITVTDSCGNEAVMYVRCCYQHNCCTDTIDYSFTCAAQMSYSQQLFYIEAVGGCPPYQWAVLSGDAIFDSSITNVPINILRNNTLKPDGTYLKPYVAFSIVDRCATMINSAVVYQGCEYTTLCVDVTDEEDGETNFYDFSISGVALTGYGVGTASPPVIQNGGILFSGEQYISIANSSILVMNGGIGQVSFDIMFNTLPVAGKVHRIWLSQLEGAGVTEFHSAILYAGAGSSNYITVTAYKGTDRRNITCSFGQVITGKWYHFDLIKTGSTAIDYEYFYMYKDKVQMTATGAGGSGSDPGFISSSWYGTYHAYIGKANTASEYPSAYINNFKWYNGSIP